MIYTSYFAKARTHTRVVSGELRPISVAANVPQWWPVLEECFPFKPSPVMVSAYKARKITAGDYAVRYRRDSLAPAQKYLDKLLEILSDSVLLCYEAPDKFCHRRIIANWVYETCGIWIPELDVDVDIPEKIDDVRPIVQPEGAQISLF